MVGMPSRIVLFDPRMDLAKLEEALRKSTDAHLLRCREESELMSEIELREPDLVIVDWQPSPEWRALLGRIRAKDPMVPIVASPAEGDVALAQQAIESGASDVLVRKDRLLARVRTLLDKVMPIVSLVRDNRTLRENLAQSHWAPILMASGAMRQAVRRAEAVSRIRRPVLVLGERGTGKELLVRHIHHSGPDRGRPFVAVNCAALTESLLESELFGHERGAFTGAERRTPGRFEQAHQGTLLLDEIGHMSMPCQVAILRAVEYGLVRRVGATEDIRVDVRIVGATNADLSDLMERGLFLRDLYDRLSFEVITIPPLRERPEDISLLAESFLVDFQREFSQGEPKELSEHARAALLSYPFPGNVRELKTVIERAAFHDSDGVIDLDDLGLETAHHGQPAREGDFKSRVAAFEASLLAEALHQARGNQAQAARALGLSYHQLRYFVKKHSL